MTDEESVLHALATRLIPSRQGRGGAEHAELQLLAGRLPLGLPFELPIPSSCRVIGTLVDGPFRTVLLDTDLTPQQVLSFYRDHLIGMGWTPLETGRTRGGFEFANHSHGVFCRGPQGPKLTLNVHADPAAPTEARLNLDLTPDTPCVEPGGPHPRPGPIPSLPELAPPFGAILQKGPGEASPFGTSTNAQLTTGLDLAAVASHYAGQMRQAGCFERDHGQGDALAWSTWILDDPDHGLSQALFLALQQPGNRRHYFLYERVAWIVDNSAIAG